MSNSGSVTINLLILVSDGHPLKMIYFVKISLFLYETKQKHRNLRTPTKICAPNFLLLLIPPPTPHPTQQQTPTKMQERAAVTQHQGLCGDMLSNEDQVNEMMLMLVLVLMLMLMLVYVISSSSPNPSLGKSLPSLVKVGWLCLATMCIAKFTTFIVQIEQVAIVVE